MGMYEWAKKEVEIAKEREKEGLIANGEDIDILAYTDACYDSALKAMKSLLDDGHSGTSIKLTQKILNRLIDQKPLKSINENENIWAKLEEVNGEIIYQCSRYSGLFLHVNADGSIMYTTTSRAYGIDTDTGSTYTSNLLNRIVDEMFPVKLPYYPEGNGYQFLTRDFLFDKKNGDFDTIGVYECIKPDGTKIDVNRFFAEKEGHFVEITKDEYLDRLSKQVIK